MVGVAQLAEHQVVALGVVGSSPITHPIFSFFQSQAPVAQLDRASDFESAGRGFESLRARQNPPSSHIRFFLPCFFVQLSSSGAESECYKNVSRT